MILSNTYCTTDMLKSNVHCTVPSLHLHVKICFEDKDGFGQHILLPTCFLSCEDVDCLHRKTCHLYYAVISAATTCDGQPEEVHENSEIRVKLNQIATRTKLKKDSYFEGLPN